MNKRQIPSRQRGVILFLALIVLVAMLLSGIALFRTADSGILTAGNLSLHKSAINQADRGFQTAIDWLTNAAGTGLLLEDPNLPGYTDTPFYVANALNDHPLSGQSWQSWWSGYVTSHAPQVLPPDPNTGHVVSYLIQRMCSANGTEDAVGQICARSPEEIPSDDHDGDGPFYLRLSTYYRIIVRVNGPRNTVAFMQTFVIPTN
ncbi:pilus assembly PilX family protein [Sulfuricystis thermophila]|uniref:pilus assembly PilX family protein n=1 Tax=Sulfuricystis thermophila TaxID=2496847 RepID=UPI0010357718|nr:hypothetical protein [Sulfuricystis thermophila]